MRYFNYCQGLTMTSRRMERLLAGRPRKPETPLTQRKMDIAASIQALTEEIVLRMARHVRALTGQRSRDSLIRQAAPSSSTRALTSAASRSSARREMHNRCFMATNMDVLVLENCLLLKDRQPQAHQHEIDEYMARFQLD